MKRFNEGMRGVYGRERERENGGQCVCVCVCVCNQIKANKAHRSTLGQNRVR